MGDLIERQLPIDRINKKLAEVYQYPKTEYAEGYVNACKAARQMISEIPSAQPEPRWTSCNERMPEATDYYLIQYSRRICQDEMAVAFYSVEEAELDKNYTWEFNAFADWKEVVAWMPLPKSYER